MMTRDADVLDLASTRLARIPIDHHDADDTGMNSMMTYIYSFNNTFISLLTKIQSSLSLF